jgi:hypothetical protein
MRISILSIDGEERLFGNPISGRRLWMPLHGGPVAVPRHGKTPDLAHHKTRANFGTKQIQAKRLIAPCAVRKPAETPVSLPIRVTVDRPHSHGFQKSLKRSRPAGTTAHRADSKASTRSLGRSSPAEQ